MSNSCRRGAATLALVASLCGCANNPYIAPAQPVRPASTAAPGTMDYALQYADNLREAYYAKLPEEFLRERNLSGGLMTLATAGIAAAAGGAHRDVLVDMALAGVLAYQLGTWDTSRSRQDIYLQGMKAVTCAKVAIAPLRLQPDDLSAIRDRAAATRAAIVRASYEAGQLARWIVMTPGSGGLSQVAQDELTAYDRDFRQASQALARAGTLQRDVNQAGNYLELQLNKIEDSVTDALNGTRADLRNLPGVIANIASYAGMFQPGLQVENFRVAGVTRANRSSTAESRHLQKPPAPGVQMPPSYAGLREWRAIMVSSTDELAGLLVTANPEQIKASLANCGVDTTKLSGQLSVSPANVPLAQGGEETVQIFGGTPPYNVTPVGALANGLTIRLDPPATITVKASTTASLGDHQVVVRDSANAAFTVTVDVQSAANGGAPQSTAQSKHLANVQGACPHGNLSREQVCFMQSELGVVTDGLFGPQTCDAVRGRFGQGRINQTLMDQLTAGAGLSAQPTIEEYRQYAQRKGLLAACKVQAPVAAAPAAGAAGIAEARPGCVLVAPNRQCRVTGAQCEAECNLSEDQVVNIGRSLGLAAPPKTFDKTLRAALAEFQKKRGLANKVGDFTLETANALPPVPR